MKNNKALKWFATSCFFLAAVIIVAVGMEVSKNGEAEEGSYFSQGILSEIDVFENLSFVDASEAISEEISEAISFDVLSKNEESSEIPLDISDMSDESGIFSNDGSEFSSESSSSQSEEVSFENSSEDVSENSSENVSEMISADSSKENSEEQSKENSENSENSEIFAPSEDYTSYESSEESADNVSREPSSFPDDVTTLEGGEEPFVFFKQDSPEWNDKPYGTNKIGSHGCGPVNMAMVISTITGNVIYPDEAAKWSVDNGYWSKNVGTSHALMNAMAKAYGVKVTTLPQTSWNEAMNALKEGKYIITRVKNGIFATNNHFLTIRGITDDGKLLIANSISYEDSVKEWSQSTIKKQVNLGFWVFG